MNTPIGDKLFQNIPRHVAKFRENRPKDVEKSVDGKNNTTKIEQSSLSLSRSRATVVSSATNVIINMLALRKLLSIKCVM